MELLHGSTQQQQRLEKEGILATDLQSKLEHLGIETRVMSAIPMESICEIYIQRRAAHHMENGRVIICAAGSKSPCFTMGSAAVLRASELNCQVLMKGTKVDGVYSADSLKNRDATFYPELTYQQVLTDNLRAGCPDPTCMTRNIVVPVLHDTTNMY